MKQKELDGYQEFVKGIWRENPVFVQVLGMCPMLAVTNSAMNAVVMGVATFFVLVASSFMISSLQHWIPRQVRISLYIVIIATFVTLADYTILATLPAAHKQLGAFIPLIVVNCMILGRQEAFASRFPVKYAVLDAVGMAGGFLFAMLALGSVREILGTGTLFDIPLFGKGFEPWVTMILPPGGFLTLGLILLFFNWVTKKRGEFLQQVATEREGL
ncbi:MAG: electron transport complex subunit E [Gammaproteobacteria bacterium]|nr:electron transport complex subunit E [Gammaproteobacteria bacterium]MBU1654792.1 electron transport complex subunit E [Gammaproteobacteria bacterium]MBU1961443.1 electron transport complex subunit E [Gammaproteobacteria bacterium]